MINGAHAIIYSHDPEADRAFFKEVLGLHHVDAGGGWLIFALPPAEVAVHPAEPGKPGHELFLICRDIDAALKKLTGKGVPVEPLTYRLPVCRAPNCATGPRRARCAAKRIPPARATILRWPPSQMQTRDITIHELKGGGYLALPEGPGPHPGVIVIHEATGLDDHIRRITDRFAGAGYAALAVDLFA